MLTIFIHTLQYPPLVTSPTPVRIPPVQFNPESNSTAIHLEVVSLSTFHPSYPLAF